MDSKSYCRAASLFGSKMRRQLGTYVGAAAAAAAAAM